MIPYCQLLFPVIIKGGGGGGGGGESAISVTNTSLILEKTFTQLAKNLWSVISGGIVHL